METQIVFIVMSSNSVFDLNIDFVLGNQRPRMKPRFPLENFNATKIVKVIVRAAKAETEFRKLGNVNLFYEMFVNRNLSSSDALNKFKYNRLVLPKTQRDYVRVKGRLGLKDALILNDVRVDSNLTFFRFCREKLDAVNIDECVTYANDAKEKMSKALTSRWSTNCSRFVFSDESEFVVLPVNDRVDVFFVLVNKHNDVIRVEDTFEARFNFTSKSVGASKIIQVEDSTRLSCPNEDVRRYEKFYVPIIVSAAIHKNVACIKEICDVGFYAEDEIFHFLGPYEDLWSSACFAELGHDVIGRVASAKFVSVNKFWPFENFNYLVFGNVEESAESVYLSQSAFILETSLGFLMSLVALLTLTGNAVVFSAILNDEDKTIYQFLQMSLCLADALMAISGAGGGIALVQFQLLFGGIRLEDFLSSSNAFTASFERPEAARLSGLNAFYFMTSHPAFVIRGAFVSLSTTVSLVLLCAMAFTRYQVVKNAHGALFLVMQRSKFASAFVAPWLIGAIITALHFVDPFNDEDGAFFAFQAYFDPVSKLTILLPATSTAFSFYAQTTLAAILSLTTIAFSVLAWRDVSRSAEAVRGAFLAQERQTARRLREERRWMLTTSAIVAAFLFTVVPVFICYVASNAPLTLHLAAWWLLVAGAGCNVVIYAAMNVNMRRSVKRLFGCRKRTRKSTSSSTTRTSTTQTSSAKEQRHS